MWGHTPIRILAFFIAIIMALTKTTTRLDRTKSDSLAFKDSNSLIADGVVVVDDDGNHVIPEGVITDTPEFFEDTSFVVGDSPVTLDINTALGRNATRGYIINDGAGNFTIAFSTDGAAFGDAITMKQNEVLRFTKISVDSLKITWVADSAYRASFI